LDRKGVTSVQIPAQTAPKSLALDSQKC